MTSEWSCAHPVQPGDVFSIYQCKEQGEAAAVRFLPYDYLCKIGVPIREVNYNRVYTAPLESGLDLEGVFTRFNCEIPPDFRGHSLSVSDVVVLQQGENKRAFYCDSIGFQEVTGFLLSEATQEISEPEPAL